MSLVTIVGIGASVFTAGSLVPQLAKLIKEKRSKDVSLGMLLVLMTGLTLWIYYGVLNEDLIIILSNAFALLVNVLIFILALNFKKRPARTA